MQGIKNIRENNNKMKNNILKIVAVVLLCWMATEANAQWSVGVKGGMTRTSIDRTNLGRIDESYSTLNGFEIGVNGRYEFFDWLAVRADLGFMKRSYRMDRSLNYLDPVYTKYKNSYLMLPVMADLSFGGERLRGHLLGGGFVGYWLSSRVVGKTYWMTDYYVYFNDFDEKRSFNDEDRRFTAGLVGGISMSYDINEHIGVNCDALYYYDLVSHHKGYKHLSDPRYLNTLSICLGVYYIF